MRCRLTKMLEAVAGGFLQIGHEIEHPQAYLLVKMGCARPVDEECRLKASMTEEAMQKAGIAYEKVDKGIDPDDYDAYDQGYMRGYNPDGSWIPGPNYMEYEELQWKQRRKESPIIIVDD